MIYIAGKPQSQATEQFHYARPWDVLTDPRIPTKAELTQAEKRLKWQREYQKSYQRKVRASSKERKLLDAKGRQLVSLEPNKSVSVYIESAADKAKTAKLIGKPNHARSQ